VEPVTRASEREVLHDSGVRVVRGWGNRALALALCRWPNRWGKETLDTAQAHPDAFEDLDVDGVVAVLDKFDHRPRT
jgi:hypothetical protein